MGGDDVRSTLEAEAGLGCGREEEGTARVCTLLVNRNAPRTYNTITEYEAEAECTRRTPVQLHATFNENLSISEKKPHTEPRKLSPRAEPPKIFPAPGPQLSPHARSTYLHKRSHELHCPWSRCRRGRRRQDRRHTWRTLQRWKSRRANGKLRPWLHKVRRLYRWRCRLLRGEMWLRGQQLRICTSDGLLRELGSVHRLGRAMYILSHGLRSRRDSPAGATRGALASRCQLQRHWRIHHLCVRVRLPLTPPVELSAQ